MPVGDPPGTETRTEVTVVVTPPGPPPPALAELRGEISDDSVVKIGIALVETGIEDEPLPPAVATGEVPVVEPSSEEEPPRGGGTKE